MNRDELYFEREDAWRALGCPRAHDMKTAISLGLRFAEYMNAQRLQSGRPPVDPAEIATEMAKEFASDQLTLITGRDSGPNAKLIQYAHRHVFRKAM